MTRQLPIPFCADMVRALMTCAKCGRLSPTAVCACGSTEFRKTMTRRAIRGLSSEWTLGITPQQYRPGSFAFFDMADPVGTYPTCFRCPYQPGDELWVRETWRIGAWDEDEGTVAVDYKADGYSRREWLQCPDPDTFQRLWIQSTDDARVAGVLPDAEGRYHWEPGQAPTRWRPSMFMPKLFARNWLKVLDVRPPERVQEINEEDAIAEGIEYHEGVHRWRSYNIRSQTPFLCATASHSYQTLWDSLNSKKHPWSSNPWLWPYRFQRIDAPAAKE